MARRRGGNHCHLKHREGLCSFFVKRHFLCFAAKEVGVSPKTFLKALVK